jgi:hypothetical protein
MENDGGMISTWENRRTQRKTCPSATLSTTNLTWIDPGANSGLSGERLATNRLSHGMAKLFITHILIRNNATRHINIQQARAKPLLQSYVITF